MDQLQYYKQPAHVVLVSSPGLGHIIPMIELGNRFVLHHNFKATVIAVTSNTSEAESHVIKSATTNSLCDVIGIPSPADLSSLAFVSGLCVATRESVPSIRSTFSDMALPPSALIVDIFSTEVMSVAIDLNIPKFVYVASNAWFLSLLVYSPVLDRQVQGQYVDQKEPLKIPGCNPVRAEDVVDPMLDRNDLQYEEYYLSVCNGIPKGDAVLVNTWEELQPKVLEALRDGLLKIPVYAIGPLVRQPGSETGRVNESVVRWLDIQPSESVVYVSFGSGGTVSFEQMREIAWGLELSERRFVWVVREPTEGPADAAVFTTGCSDGDSSSTDDETRKYLPEGFVERTREVGLLVQHWAPQVTVLRHPSVGAFFTHCGWGSAIESITSGVPMIAWPLYAEQRMNAMLLAEELGVAVRSTVLPTKEVVGREEIASMVRKVIPRSSQVRERVREMKLSAEKALSRDGSSYAALSHVAQIIDRSEDFVTLSRMNTEEREREMKRREN